MLGTSTLIISSGDNSSPGPVDLTAFISPNTIDGNSPNGSWTSPTVRASASGGTKPYSYSWTATNGTVTENGASANVRLSGYNELLLSELTCTVTDDNGDTAQGVANITIFFGDELR